MSIGCKMWMWHSPSTHVETPRAGTRGYVWSFFYILFVEPKSPCPKNRAVFEYGVCSQLAFLEPPLNSRLGDSDPDPRTHELGASPHLRVWYLDSVDGWTWRNTSESLISWLSRWLNMAKKTSGTWIQDRMMKHHMETTHFQSRNPTKRRIQSNNSYLP